MKNNNNQPILTIEWASQAPLDSVCVSIATIYQRDSRTIDGDIFACMVKRLIQVESRPGGPYKNRYGVIDLTTNLAIGYLFATLKKPLPLVAAYIASNRAKTPLSNDIRRLLKKYDSAMAALQATPSSVTRPAGMKAYQQAATRLLILDSPAKDHAMTFLKRIQDADRHQEISGISTLFAASLTTPVDTLPLTVLGEANIYCWMAYMIYDHIIDDEPVAYQLPIANIAMRLSISTYQAFFSTEHPFQHNITTTFNSMDTANSWELHNCRFKVREGEMTIMSLPHYGNHYFLAQRSLGHILGPLALAHLIPYTPEQIRYLEKGFHHYLIARQLNDDLHDWKEDVRAGHASSIVTYILRSMQVKPKTYNLDKLIAHMQTNFWNHSLEPLCNTVHRHVDLSKKYFLKSQLIKPGSPLLALITRLDLSTTEITNEYRRYRSFSAAYRNTP